MSVTLELLQEAQEGSEKATTQLLQENTGLIWSVIRRYYGRGVESDDLYQLGCLGFLKAVRGFDTSFGTQFSTYAVPKIAGEVRRFLRDDGAVKVSRTLKEQSLSIKMARSRLCVSLNREPTVSELAAELGLTPEEIAAAETATESVTSLQTETGEGLTLESMLSDGTMEENTVEKIALSMAMKQIPEKEREVLYLRYYKGLTQSNCAKILKVSQVQVSRLEKKGVLHLRELMTEE